MPHRGDFAAFLFQKEHQMTVCAQLRWVQLVSKAVEKIYREKQKFESPDNSNMFQEIDFLVRYNYGQNQYEINCFSKCAALFSMALAYESPENFIPLLDSGWAGPPKKVPSGTSIKMRDAEQTPEGFSNLVLSAASLSARSARGLKLVNTSDSTRYAAGLIRDAGLNWGQNGNSKTRREGLLKDYFDISAQALQIALEQQWQSEIESLRASNLHKASPAALLG